MPGPDALMWIDGELVAAADAAVSVLDHGLVVGDAAFETLQIVDRTPFAFTRHIRRLHTTLAALGVPAPGEPLLRDAMAQTVGANEMRTGRLRLTVTGGPGPLGTGEPHGPATVIVGVEPLGERPPPTAVTAPWTRNETGATAGLKTTSYAENVRALRYAHEHDAGEALFANTKGELCEGTGTNVFVALDGTVHTPPLRSGCLAGVTRELLLEQMEAVETDLPVDVLREADEVFLTSSTRDVQPLAKVDGRTIPTEGPCATRAVTAFAALKAADLDP